MAPRPTVHRLALLLPALSVLAACSDDARAETTTSTTTTSTTASTSSSSGPVAPTSDPTTTTTSSDTDAVPDLTTTTTTTTTATTHEATTTDATTTADTATTTTTTTDPDTTTGPVDDHELRVLQMNLCHSGVAGCFKGDAPLSKAVAVITDVAPGLVTLNEVCRADVAWLAEQTGALDHRFTPALKANDTPVQCKNGDDYGNGLLSWSAPTWPAAKHGVYAAQSSTTERRVWICMGYTGFVGCTTHLSTSGATALKQCHALVDGPLTDALDDGPAVMAGDWNLKYKGDPDAQDCVPGPFYRKGDGSLQHVIASDDLTFLETIVIDMAGTTDHPGLEVRLTLP